MADVSDDGGSVAVQIDDSEETFPDELNAVARENALRVERNRKRIVSDDEPLIEAPSRATSPAPSSKETLSSVDPSLSLTMHPALQNSDIIYTICLYIHHRSLPALASTCRIFERPALDVLWRNLQSVEPLVKCLPSDLFGTELGSTVLVKPLDTRIWGILCKYTSRVYSITQSGRSAVIEPLGSLMLSCPLAPASLFPNLRRLKWHTDGTHCAAGFLRVAFVPTLLSLGIQISSASSIFLSVLSSLGALCPQLQTLYMRFPSATHDLFRKVSPFVARSISQLHRLQVLFVWDLGDQGNQHLMQLQALQTLWLDLKTSSAWERQSLSRSRGFHDLDSLVLFIDNLEHASNFLSSLQVIDSENIGIRLTGGPFARSSTALSQFFTILGETCNHNNLTSFHLLPSTKVSTNPDIFKPLSTCHNLTQLLVEHSWNISMADEELCQLVRGWPKLRVLSISRFVAINETTIPTFHGLINLLRLCPALTSLTLVIDTTELDGIDLKTPGGGIVNNHLEKLVLTNSPMTSPLKVALVLSGLFPKLLKVDLDCWDLAPKNLLPQKESAVQLEQWQAVNLFILGFGVVRERIR
ncbi:hypothetical protein BDR07DRAFT_1359286 [Suillus spraguei]|nr:hypothetical protein BDR07DRAFT_1359286 [Suillus spraguei]